MGGYAGAVMPVSGSVGFHMHCVDMQIFTKYVMYVMCSEIYLENRTAKQCAIRVDSHEKASTRILHQNVIPASVQKVHFLQTTKAV